MPEGFVYREEVLSAEEERHVVDHLALLPFAPFEFHGFQGRRRVVSFGWRYDYAGRQIRPSAQLPEFLLPLRECAAQVGDSQRKACSRSWSPNMRPERRSAGIATSRNSRTWSQSRSSHPAFCNSAGGGATVGNAARST